jgi:hypothetical protein
LDPDKKRPPIRVENNFGLLRSHVEALRVEKASLEQRLAIVDEQLRVYESELGRVEVQEFERVQREAKQALAKAKAAAKASAARA